MRKILFRGKFGYEWKCGYLTIEPNGLYIKGPYKDGQTQLWRIDPKTVGQYTGLKDKNGKKIFEGDICDFTAFKYDGSDRQFCGAVIYDGSRFVLTDSKEKDVLYDLDFILLNDDGFEIIGNIFDNPELLEVQK